MGLQPPSRLSAAQSSADTRLIVVSNRLPLTLRKTEDGWSTEYSSGGLASAMDPLLRKGGGDWIGWAGGGGEEHDESRRAILAQWAENERCFAVELPEQVATGFYEGYANQTLWPVFHNFPSHLKFDAKSWEAYVEANRIFSEAVVDRYRRNDLIWVHDYHLMLLPQMLRDRLPDAAIGFFLHIPFSSSEIFPVLPRREELLDGLLGADLLAFQTHGHLQQFRAALLRVLGMESKIQQVAVGSRPVRLEALPSASRRRNTPTCWRATKLLPINMPSGLRATADERYCLPSTGWIIRRGLSSACVPTLICFGLRQSSKRRLCSSRSRCLPGRESTHTRTCEPR